MVKLALGIILILAGMGVAFMIWNLLMGTDVVYLPSRLARYQPEHPGAVQRARCGGLYGLVLWPQGLCGAFPADR